MYENIWQLLENEGSTGFAATGHVDLMDGTCDGGCYFNPKEELKLFIFGNYNNMKVHSLIILMILIIASGCGRTDTKTNIWVQQGSENEPQWEDRFKNLILCNCVLQGIGNKSIADSIMIKDKSFYDPIQFVLKDDIKRLLQPVLLKMKQDSLTSLTTVGEGAQGKQVFNICLDFYKSKKLDSLAEVELKKWNKLNVDSIMEVNAPAY